MAFNTGVELGQLAVLGVLLPALEFAFRRILPERIGTIVLSALVAHTGWHWMLERWERLHQYRLDWVQAGLVTGGLLLLSAVVWDVVERRRKVGV